MKPITYTALPVLHNAVRDKLKAAATVCRCYRDEHGEIRSEYASQYDSAFRKLEKIEEAARELFGVEVTREPFRSKSPI